MVHILPVDNKTIELAIASDFSDFEDAIQYSCAMEYSVRALVTRNIKDYKRSGIPDLIPEMLIA